MTFGEIREEVKASGLDHLSDTRVNRFINLAYRRTYNKELWPWRIDETSSAAPVTVTGTIRQVLDADGNVIPKNTQENLENNGYVLTETGPPAVWYLDETRSVSLYPASSDVTTVRYYREVTDLTSDSTEPDLPDAYHYLIVLDAVRRGKTENGEIEAAVAYANDYNELFADLKRYAFNEEVAGPLQLNDLSEGV